MLNTNGKWMQRRNKTPTNVYWLCFFNTHSSLLSIKMHSQVSPGPQGQPGIRSQFATLNVLVPPEAPRILQGDFMLTTEDKDIELTCISIGGKPAATVRVTRW